jgi:hypothetical protein
MMMRDNEYIHSEPKTLFLHEHWEEQKMNAVQNQQMKHSDDVEKNGNEEL